jgi:hypothetical protein
VKRTSYESVSKSFRTESIRKYTLITISTRWEATQRVIAAKLTRLTHKILIQLHLAAQSYTICSSRSRRPVRKLRIHPRMTLLIMQSSLSSRHFLPLESKYSPEHPVLRHPPSVFLPSFLRVWNVRGAALEEQMQGNVERSAGYGAKWWVQVARRGVMTIVKEGETLCMHLNPRALLLLDGTRCCTHYTYRTLRFCATIHVHCYWQLHIYCLFLFIVLFCHYLLPRSLLPFLLAFFRASFPVLHPWFLCVRTLTPCFPKILFNIILLPTALSPKWSLSFRFSYWNFVVFKRLYWLYWFTDVTYIMLFWRSGLVPDKGS